MPSFNPKIALGCMPLTGCYKKTANAEELIETAYNHGIRLFDTADNYGNNTNEILLGKAIRPFRNAIEIATKVGVIKTNEGILINGSTDYIQKACEASLKRLDVEAIDILYYHHLDPNVPIEETITAMTKLVKEGKVKKIGLFEMELDILKRAYKVYPIDVYQAEYSLIIKGVEKEILSFCKKHHIAFFANAPLGRGLLIDHPNYLIPLGKEDLRSIIPRFQPPHIEKNIVSLNRLANFANSKGLTLSQLSLCWLLKKDVIPIFGTTNKNHLIQNIQCLSHQLDETSLQELDPLLEKNPIFGDRIPLAAKSMYLK